MNSFNGGKQEMANWLQSLMEDLLEVCDLDSERLGTSLPQLTKDEAE